jgi:ABC-2 type transport system ATP-binding protein
MLTLHKIHKSFGNRAVLRDLNFRIEPGEVYGLLGPNGAGKTTTINLICQLLAPDRGTIAINEQPVSDRTKPWLGVAPQDNLLYRSLSCAENLAFFGKIYGLSRQQRHKQIPYCLQSVNLSDRAKSPIESLSGGMQRRLNIACALVHQPKLLILDEPTTGLDIEARFEIWDLIQRLQQQGMTILLTTHLLDEAQRLCQRIGILREGTIAQSGTLDQLRQVIPAKEILTLQTPTPARAILRGQELGFTYRYYGNDLAFWLPKHYELKEIIEIFDGITLDSISRQAVQLEHIYLEVTQGIKTPSPQPAAIER